MRIKTIVSYNTDEFDAQANEAFEDGWHMTRREVNMDDIPTFYAELVKMDEAPAPDPLEALRIVRDFCEETPEENCLGKCPLTPWCAMHTHDGESPADWLIPDEEVGR